MSNYYQILGVSENASEKEIKLKFRELAKKFHPDKNPGDAIAEKKFKEISEAYDVLSNPEKRSHYNQVLHAPPNPFGGFGFDFSSIFGDFGDIFNRRASNAQPKRGNEDLGLRIHLSFWEGVKGCKKEIAFERPVFCVACDGGGTIGNPVNCTPCRGSGRVEQIAGPMRVRTTCPTCSGAGRVADPCSMCAGRGYKLKNENVAINIPPGIDSGQMVRLAGKGSHTSSEFAPGNLMIEVEVSQGGAGFRRDNHHIHSEEIIPFTKAALGGETSVKTIFGNKKLHIPRGSRDGSTVVITSAGIKSDKKIGNHYVKFRINFPSELTNEQVELLEQLDKTL